MFVDILINPRLGQTVPPQISTRIFDSRKTYLHGVDKEGHDRQWMSGEAGPYYHPSSARDHCDMTGQANRDMTDQG